LTAFHELVVIPPDEVRVTTRSLNILTPRERQILESLVQGSTTREIANSYGLGRQTVKNYATVIYEKLGVCGRSQLCERVLSRDAWPGFRERDARKTSQEGRPLD
jgi:DNA-binding NarL/FixJ family response regulator